MAFNVSDIPKEVNDLFIEEMAMALSYGVGSEQLKEHRRKREELKIKYPEWFTDGEIIPKQQNK